MKTKKTFYVTTPIYYPTDKPHLGTAYTTIAADILARWNKLYGKEVFFLTGTDEHGQKLDEAAKKAGKDPKEFVDALVKDFKNAWQLLDINFDYFIRTTDPMHEETVKTLIKQIYEKGDLYKGDYEGLYCVPCESYWTEKDLMNEKCPSCNRDVQKIKEKAYFFRLSKYQKKLLALYKKNPEFVLPDSKRHEILNRVKEGLKDVSFTRSKFKWGVEFPLDKNLVLWVWADALTNYISALDWPDGKNFKEYWPANIHLIGKDILWFHTAIWPAMLMSAGIKLPKTVFAHGWWTIGEEKMSKSKGNAVDPLEIANKYGADSLRYFLFRSTPFGDDGDFSEQALKDRHNNELANKLGNLVSRTAGMCKGDYKKSSVDKELTGKLKSKEISEHIENYEFDKALNLIFEYLDECNNYVQTKEPWKLEGKEKEKVLYNLVDSIRVSAILLEPFMPSAMEKIRKQFGFEKQNVKGLKFGLTKSGKVEKCDVLFKKIE